jgi:dihydrolipoamide dehydrogenase
MADKNLIVIGGGPGGYVAALRAAMNGVPATVIEEDDLGGTCLNAGCIPTKALVATAALIEKARAGAALGVNTGEAVLDFPAAMGRKDAVVSRLVKGVEALFKKRKITLIKGRAELLGPDAVRVNGQDVAASHIIIATGSDPAKPAFFPFDGERVLTPEKMLSIGEVPRRLLIAGGGVVGCEMARIFAAFGSEVHVVEMLPRILSTIDEDLGKELVRAFKKSKIKLSVGVKVESIERRGDAVHAGLSTGASVEADCVLVAAGRTPRSAGLGLDAAGVNVDAHGFIPVDNTSRTNVENIYAAGDVTGRYQLAHAASAQGVAAADHVAGRGKELSGDVMPACIFTHPELATVGLSEAEAKEKGYDVKCGKFLLRVLGKAQAMGEIAGFVKLVGDAATGRLLGMHVAGAEASSLIHEGALALTLGASIEDIARTVHAHPTLAEGIMEAAEDYLGGALHG